MEHIYENQQPDEPLAHDAYIQNLGRENPDPRAVLEKIKQFGRDVAYDEDASKAVMGKLVCGALDIPEEMVDDESVTGAKRMLLFGAMTALYVGNGMMDGYMSNKDVLDTASELMKDGPRALLRDGVNFVDSMDSNSKRVLDQWKTALSASEVDELNFNIGFGAMMCSVNKTIYEIDLIHNLENSIEWTGFDSEITPESTVSVDDDCLMLARSFQDHVDAIQLDLLPIDERRAALQQIAEFLKTDILHTKELKPDDTVETRGMGVCIGYNEQNSPDGIYGYDDSVKIRGRVARIDCMSVPTEFAIIMGADYEAYEPQLCLVLDNVEMIEPDGSASPHDSHAAIPLRVSGSTQLNKIIHQVEK